MITLRGKMYNLTEVYDNKFYVDNLEDSQPIAEYLAPIIVDKLKVNSILDFGCATGHWISAFNKKNVKVKGIEGSNSILNNLVVSEDFIYNLDLRYLLDKSKIDLPEKIDLSFSFEVAEHIEENFADIFLENLILWNPEYIMLTAAPPGQGGLGHVNEQPKMYWYNKLELKGYIQDKDNEIYFSNEIEKARKLNNVPKNLQRPDMEIVCQRFQETIGCENGVWVPPWLPKNLMVLKRK